MRAPSAPILVIDSDRTNAEVIAAILGDEGYAASHATSPTAALDRVAQQPPALIILDATLPRPTAGSLRKLLAAHDRARTPIIGSTTNPAQAEAARPGDPETWLLKPFTIDSLLTCVAEALERSNRAAARTAAR